MQRLVFALCLFVVIFAIQCSKVSSDSDIVGKNLTSVNGNSVLSNFGGIHSVFINEFLSDGLTSDISPVADFFIGKNISVCLVRNILCWGNSRTDANSCSASVVVNIESIPASYKLSSNNFNIDSVSQYINWLAPLDLRGVFTNVVIGNDTIEFAKLNPIDKMDFIYHNHALINRLSWDSVNNWWAAVGSDIKVIASKEEVPFLKKFILEDVQLAIAIEADNRFKWKSTDSLIGTTTLHQKDRNIPWDAICPDRLDSTCIKDVIGQITRWAQDEYHVRSNSSKLLRRRIPCVRNTSQLGFQLYADNLCSRGSGTLDSLPIQGGNFFIAGNFVFIGRNELISFKSCENWLSTMGLKVNASVSDISSALNSQISGSNPAARIIWIGDKMDTISISKLRCEKRLMLDNKYQPLFHIDMFFHPLGAINQSKPKDFYYLIATLDSNFHLTGNWTPDQQVRFQILKQRLNHTFNLLKNDISKEGKIIPKPIEIPLLVDFDANGNMRVVAFSNGISSNVVNHSSYFMPAYSWIGKPSSGFKNVKYNQALKSTIESLTKTGLIEVDTVTGAYSEGALNCMVKVLKRTP